MLERPPHALVSNVTPWWWGTHHDGESSKRAIDVMRDRFDAEPRIRSFTVQAQGIHVELALEPDGDAGLLRTIADALRDTLDDLVSTGEESDNGN
jgi:hypothetical protein